MTKDNTWLNIRGIYDKKKTALEDSGIVCKAYVPGRRLQMCGIHETIHCLASQLHIHLTSEYKRF